jgi:glycosyltransferase involved in cell wall biosynthesis
MVQGTPVLASNATCFPEVYEHAAEYFDPKDAKDLANKIDTLITSPKRLEELRAAGHEQVKKYSWKKMAQETLTIYNDQA